MTRAELAQVKRDLRHAFDALAKAEEDAAGARRWRAAAIQDLRDFGCTWPEIAELCGGVSPQRAQQYLSEGQEGLTP